MDTTRFLDFIKSQRWAVEATVTEDGTPQAALIGIAVTDRLEVVFDTVASTRKLANLRTNPRIALVIGGWSDGDPRTLQYDGVADFPSGAELERVRAAYFAAFPDGPTRLAWPGITYVRVTPTWLRLSDYTVTPPSFLEITLPLQSES